MADNIHLTTGFLVGPGLYPTISGAEGASTGNAEGEGIYAMIQGYLQTIPAGVPVAAIAN